MLCTYNPVSAVSAMADPRSTISVAFSGWKAIYKWRLHEITFLQTVTETGIHILMQLFEIWLKYAPFSTFEQICSSIESGFEQNYTRYKINILRRAHSGFRSTA